MVPGKLDAYKTFVSERIIAAHPERLPGAVLLAAPGCGRASKQGASGKGDNPASVERLRGAAGAAGGWMNLQHERLSHLCTELRLGGVAVEYPAAAQKAAETEASFMDFLETVLRGELDTCRARARTMLSRVAGFPAIKTLDQFDFEFAVGAPRQQIQQLAGLSFIERAENVCSATIWMVWRGDQDGYSSALGGTIVAPDCRWQAASWDAGQVGCWISGSGGGVGCFGADRALRLVAARCR